MSDERRVLKDAITNVIAGCTKCPLANTRTNTVPFATPLSGDLLTIVGEAPGEQEDKQGKPFVGRSGQFLASALSKTNIENSQVSIMNTVCCRPPGNRDPKPSEKTACLPNFDMQLKFTQSWLGLCLGHQAAENVLGLESGKHSINQLRENLWWRHDKLWMVTWHPSYAMKDANVAGLFRQDIQHVADVLDGTEQFDFSSVRDFEIVQMKRDEINKAFKVKGWFPITTERLGSIVCVRDLDVEVDPGYDTLPRWTVEELVKVRASSPGNKDVMWDAINHVKLQIPGTYVLI